MELILSLCILYCSLTSWRQYESNLSLLHVLFVWDIGFVVCKVEVFLGVSCEGLDEPEWTSWSKYWKWPWGILDISFLSKSKFLAVMSGEGTWEQVIFFKPWVIADEGSSGSILGRLQVDEAFSIEAWEKRFGLPKLWQQAGSCL